MVSWRGGETERGAVGRPSQQVDLHGDAFFTVRAEVNLDYLTVVALNVRREVVAQRWVPLDAGELVGVTVAVPGLVERSTGRVVRAPNLGWSRTQVVDTVRTLLGDPACPLLLDNEANLAARAELEAPGRRA